ncbi:MAG: permease [Thiotrichales bacterium SG8_50]|nr:MAG: permease [Thiotrichales bacterium SG8_50]
MFRLLTDFYHRNFSDPQAAFLALLIVVGFTVVLTTGGMLLPVFASIVIAYLLDDVVEMMVRLHVPRSRAVWLVFIIFIAFLIFVLFGLTPLVSAQMKLLVSELPDMLAKGQKMLLALPEQTPLISEEQVKEAIDAMRKQITGFGQGLLSFSLARLPGLITTVVYLVLMPLLVLFFLKDRDLIFDWMKRFFPREKTLMSRVWKDLDGQIGNYVRGKFWEMLIVGAVTAVTFSIMGLNYSVLLGVFVGLSVIVPYIGAVVVTIPVVMIASFQWGTSPEFFYVLIAYGIIQAIDGSVLVPLLFAEVVNLHPIAIIVAVLVFGGVWGFWGVFFAIPLASGVQVLITSWPKVEEADPEAPS